MSEIETFLNTIGSKVNKHMETIYDYDGSSAIGFTKVFPKAKVHVFTSSPVAGDRVVMGKLAETHVVDIIYGATYEDVTRFAHPIGEVSFVQCRFDEAAHQYLIDSGFARIGGEREEGKKAIYCNRRLLV